MTKKLKGTIIYGEINVIKGNPVFTKESLDTALNTFRNGSIKKGERLTSAKYCDYTDLNGKKIA